MFTKLLKYEFNSVKKVLKPLSIAVLLASALGYILMLLGENFFDGSDNILYIIPYIMLMASIFLFFVVYCIGSVIYIYVHFYKTKFTDQGYLTFTLPVSTHQILLSCILNFLIWIIIIALVIFSGALMISAPTFSSTQDILYFMGLYSSVKGYITVIEILAFILNIVSGLFYILVLPFLAITIGSLIAKKHKLIATLAVGYGINFGYGMLTSMISPILLTRQTIDSSTQAFSVYTIVGSVITIILSIIGYFIMHYIIDKKLNI